MKARLIYTICYQDGIEHWSQAYTTVDVDINLPEKIEGRPLKDWSYVGLQFNPQQEVRDDD